MSAVPARAARWRVILAWVVLVVATIIVFAASLSVWVNRQVLNTGNWTKTTSDLLEDDNVRAALSLYLTNQIFERVDVKAQLEERLPENLQVLAAPMTASLRSATARGVDELLSRPRVQALWKEANRAAHREFIAIIDEDTRLLEQTDGKVILDLNKIAVQVAESVGFDPARIPPDAGKLVIMDSKQLEAAQTGVRVTRAMSYFLGFLGLALYALAVFLVGHGRRRTMIMSAGFAILLVGLLELVVRRLVGNWIVDSLTKNPDFKGATASVWSIGTNLLRDVGVNLVIYGVLIALAAWIAGPSRPATALRRWLAPSLREHPVIVYGVVTLGLLILLATGPIDLSRLIPLLVLFAFAYLGVEVLRRQTAREFPETLTTQRP